MVPSDPLVHLSIQDVVSRGETSGESGRVASRVTESSMLGGPSIVPPQIGQSSGESNEPSRLRSTLCQQLVQTNLTRGCMVAASLGSGSSARSKTISQNNLRTVSVALR